MLEASKATFVTRQDARNIVRTLDKARKSRHEHDAVSVERPVQELGEKVVIEASRNSKRGISPTCQGKLLTSRNDYFSS